MFVLFMYIYTDLQIYRSTGQMGDPASVQRITFTFCVNNDILLHVPQTDHMFSLYLIGGLIFRCVTT